MKKLILVIALCIFGFKLMVAQETVENPIDNKSFDILIGFENGFLKDRNYSPLNYSTNGLALTFGYSKQLKNDNLLLFRTNFQFGEIKTKISDYNSADRYTTNLEFSYLINLPVDIPNMKLHIGGQLHTYADLVFYDGTNAITYYVLHSFDFRGRLSKKINKRHTISSDFSMPVFGLLARPPHTGWDKYIVDHQDNPVPVFFRGDWTSLNDFFAFNWSLKYQYALSQKLDLTINYEFSYHQTKQLKTAIIPTNVLSIGTTFKF